MMFNKLRNRLILINLGITSLVIFVVFTTIYIVSTKTAENRMPRIQQTNVEFQTNDDWEKIVQFSVREERESAARQLLITLAVSGVLIELFVIFLSYFLAEEAIKPVKEAYESQKIFIANASHEIKTPLAAISANLEAADIKNNKWIDNVELEAAKLADLNNQLLTLARTDLVAGTTIENVDLKQRTQKLLSTFEPRLKNKKLSCKINLDKKIRINIADFEQIFTILMDNAIKYSDQKIYIKLDEHRLEIKNDGAKISAEKLPHVFDRFYQIDKSVSGVGLGLSIAKSLCERNHWKITAKSDDFTVFILNF